MRLSSNKKPARNLSCGRRCKGYYIFFHPDYTVGSGISPDQRKLVDFNHRWGLAPRLEDSCYFVLLLYAAFLSLSTVFLRQSGKNSKLTIIKIGKRLPKASPVFKAPPSESTGFAFCAAVETVLTSQGPTEQPISPRIASTLNIAAPPFGYIAENMLNVPGQNRLIENPVKAQPKSESRGLGENAVTE